MSALRTISLRLRGTSVEILEQMGEETEGVIESTSKLQEKIKSLSGVDILSTSGDYRNPYEILKDIAEVYDDMEGMDQAALIELIAGKNRANTLAAILTNFEDLEGAYESALDAEGSAMRENAAYLDSIQGRIDLFTNAVQTMWMNFMNDDAVKFVVDFGTALVKLVDTIGVIPTAVGAFAAFKLVAKSISKDFADVGDALREAMNISDTEEAVSEVADAVKDHIDDVTHAQQENAEAKEEQADATMANVAAEQAENAVDQASAVIEAQETAQIDNNTDAQLRNMDANVQNAASDVQDNGLDASGAAIEAQETAQIQKNTKATIANTIAQKAGHAVKTLGKGLLFGLSASVLTLLAGKLMSVIDDAIHAEERAIERADEALNKYRDDQKELKDQKKTVNELADSYSRLSGGVNTLTNDNIGLTVESYNEYLDVCNKIADMYPELVQGYDAQGNAILNLQGKVDGLTASYINAQKEAANTLLTEQNKKDVWTKYTGGAVVGKWVEDGTYYRDLTLQHQKDVLNAIQLMTSNELNQLYGHAKDGESGQYDVIRNKMKELGTYVNDNILYATVQQTLNAGKYSPVYDSIDNYAEYVDKKMTEVNQAIYDSVSGIQSAVSANLIFNTKYNDKNFTEESKEIVKSIINNIDPNMIAKSDTDSLDAFLNWFSTNVVQKVADNQEMYSGLTSVSDKMAKAIFNKDNAAFTTAQTEFQTMIKNWVDESGNVVIDPEADVVTQYFQKFAKDMQNQAKNYEIRIDIQTDFDSKKSIDKAISDYTGNAKEEIQKAIDGLKLEDGASMADIYGTVSVNLDYNKDGKTRSDEIEDIYNDYLNYINNDVEMPDKWSDEQTTSIAALHAVAQLYGTDLDTIIAKLIELGYASESLDDIKFFDLSSKTTNEFVDKFQEDIEKIRDAWESLNGGDMTKSDFIDLAQEFPKIMEGIDFSDDNWMIQAKENLEALNSTLIDGDKETDGFIDKLTTMREAMVARGAKASELAIVDSFIAYAEQLRNLPPVADELQANTITGLTETYEKYKTIMAETNEVLYNGQKVSDGYYDSLKEYIDDTDALNKCFDENNKQIVTNVDALKELIAQQKEADLNSVKLAKTQAQLEYSELVRQLGDNTRNMMVFSEESDAAADSLLDQIGTIKNAISQYQMLEDSLLGTTSAFEKFAKAQEQDEQNTYGASYVEMAQTMYDALYKTGEVGSAQFWAAVEATIPDDIYKNLTPGKDQLTAISDYLNKNVFSTLTLGEDSFSIDYTDIENFVKKAQKAGTFFGTDVKSFGLSADFIYGLEEGENALEAFAKKMNMTVPQVYAMLSEMDKYTADGTGLSMLLQLDQSTTGQITYATSLLERLYTERQRLLKQGADNNILKANEAEIAKYEAQIAGLQKQATDAVKAYATIDNALANTSKKVREVLPEEIWRTELQLTGEETVQQVYQKIKDYQLDLEKPTVMELEIAKQNIKDELASIIESVGEEKLKANVTLNKDTGLYEVNDGTLTVDASTLQRYVDLMNASTFIDGSLSSAMSTTEQLLTNIDANVSKMAGTDSASNGDNKETTQSEQPTSGKITEPTTGSKPAPNQALAELTLGTSKEISGLMNAVIAKSTDILSKSHQGRTMNISQKTAFTELGKIHKQASQLQKDLLDGKIFAEDAEAQLSQLYAKAKIFEVEIPVTFDPDWATVDIDEEGAKEAESITGKANVDLNNRPLVPFDTQNFGSWVDYYQDVLNNADQYGTDYVNNVKEELDALKRGDSTATVYSQTYYKSDFGQLQDGESDAAIVVTPILPDGTVLSPGDLEAYAQQLLNGEEIEPNITLGFFDGENFAADAQQFAEGLHQSQAELYGLSDAAQSATSDTAALMEVYASNREALATLEAIEDKTYALTSDEAMAFGIQLNEGEILTVEQLINRIKRKQEELTSSGLWNPEQTEETSKAIYTYTALAEQLTNFNDMMSQTQEVISDGTEVTQAYKDSLHELGLTKNEISACFEDSNELVVTNAKLLNNLVKNSKKNVATNIKLAKSQAQLKYYNLYKEMSKYTDGTRAIDSATLNNINSLYSQMGALEQTIAKYSMLEAQLLGASNAYDKLADAQNADSEVDYGSKAEEMVNVLANAFNTAELGTQAAQVAIKGLIPESEIDKAKTLDEQMQQIYEYFTTGKVSKLFTIEFGDDGSISSVEMTKENVEAFTNELIAAGDVFHGTWDEFTLDESITNLDDFAKKIGVTKEVAFAYLTELEKYDINWLGGDYETLLDQLTSGDLEYAIAKNLQDLADLEYKAANGEFAGADGAAHYKAEKERLDAIYQANQDAARKTIANWQQAADEVETAQTAVNDAEKALKNAKAQGLDTTQLEADLKTATSDLYELQLQLAQLEQPTEVMLQLAKEDIDAEIENIKGQLAEGVEITAVITQDSETGKWTVKNGQTHLDADTAQKLANLYNESTNLNTLLTSGITTTESHLSNIATTVSGIYSLLGGKTTSGENKPTEQEDNVESTNAGVSTDNVGQPYNDPAYATGGGKEEDKPTDSSESASQIADLNAKLKEAQDNVSQLEASIETLKTEKTALEADMDAAKAEADTAISKLTEEKTAADETIAKLTEEITALETSMNTAKAESDETIAKLTSEKAELEASIEQLNAAQAEADNTIAQLTSDKAALETSIANANAMISQLETEKSELNAAIAESEANIEALKADKTEVESDLAQAKEMLSQTKAMLEEAQSALEVVNNDLATANKLIASLTATNQNLESQVTDLSAQLNSANSSLANAQVEKAAADATIAKLESALSDAEATIEELSAKTSTSESESKTSEDDEEEDWSWHGSLNEEDRKKYVVEADVDTTSADAAIDELGEKVETALAPPDPLLLNSENFNIDTLKNSLDQLGVAYTDTIGRWFDGKRELKINLPDLVSELQSQGWTETAIHSYLSQLLSMDLGDYLVFTSEPLPALTWVDELIGKLGDVPEEEQTDYKITGDGEGDVSNIGTEWSNVPETKTTHYTIYKTTIEQTKKRGGLLGGLMSLFNFANGTAHAQGTAHKGGSWGAQKTETALTGELGPELRVRGNRWELLGENGAEFNEVRKGDIIFNHKQTEELLANGYITGRGKAFAEGTIGGSAFAGINTWDDAYKSVNKAYSNKGGEELAGAVSGAADDISDAADEFREVFDWIEVRLEEINERIGLKSAELENATGASAKNAVIDDMIDLNKVLYDNLTAGATKYHTYAQKLLAKVPQEYRDAAQDGSIAIEEFVGEVDEKALNAIQEYREWVQKGADVTQQAEEALTEISNLAKQAIDNIAQEYENKASIPGIVIEQLEAYNALIETTQGAESAKIYEEMIKENNKQIGILAEQRQKMQSELNAQVEAGNIKKYSQAWYDAVGEIAAVDTEILNLTADTEDYRDTINELHLEHFENLISRFEAISDEAENLIDILSNKDLVNKDTAEWTDEGITSLGLYAQKMEVTEMQAKKYNDEIQYLNNNWKKLGYTEQEYIEKLEELKNGQYDAIKSYNDTKKAIVDLTKERVDAIKEGIEKEIEAYEELISKKKEELDAEKDLYDFQKGVANQQKEIADIERKLAALSADNSASARAKRAQLEAELAEARQELEDTYYDRSVSNQQEVLDKELEAFQEEKDMEIEGWDKYLEDTEKVVADGLATIQANTDAVYNILKDMGEEYSLSIAAALTSPWKYGEDAIQSYSEKFKMDMSKTVEELREIAAEHKKLIDEIEAHGSKNTNTVNGNVEGYQEATYVQPVQPPEEKEENKQTQQQNVTPPKKGSSVKVKVGTTHWGAKSGGKKMADFVPGRTYTVSNVVGTGANAQILLSKKDQNKKSATYGKTVYMGWINLKDLEGYASGTTGVKNSQFAWIDELGEELVIRPSNGRMTFMEKGTGVIPADLTSNLMEWGELDPSIMLERNKPVINAPHITNNNMEINMEISEVVHIDTVTNDTIPNLTKAIEKQMDKYMKNVNNNIRKYAR